MQGAMADKVIRLRWAAPCADCGAALAAGTPTRWDSDAKATRCQECPTEAPDADDHPSDPPIDPTPVDPGTAGASARREGVRRGERERRRQEAAIKRDAAWRADVHERHPLLGRVVTMTTAKPPPVHETRNTKVWAQGADGEERLGAVLDATEGIVALHDRRIPKSKANIDHLVVGSSGVFVVDAKNYSGIVERRDVGGWFRPDERLLVGGRDRTKLIEGVQWQVEQVRAALGDLDVPIHAFLCFTGPNWRRFFTRPLTVRGVGIAWPAKVAEIARRPGEMTAADVTGVATHLAATLKQA